MNKVAKAWQSQASLETVLVNELQALRGTPKLHRTARDNAILETIPLVISVVKRYEKLMGVRLWAGRQVR